MEIQQAIARAAAGRDLSAAEMEEVVAAIMSGEAGEAQIAGLLVALHVKGESAEEVTGAARAMRRFAARWPGRGDVVDTCGTGGDFGGTFNISTAAALIAAGAGLRVAKHGNRAMSGKVGGADVLEALGVRLELTPERAAACLDAVGMVFLFAPLFHPAMRHVAPVRRALGIRTIFNLLGPLANPAGARAQVVGVFSDVWLEVMAQALANLGAESALVVHGGDGLDEITLTGETRVAELRDGIVRTYTIDPRRYGIALCRPQDLSGGDVAANAALVGELVDGRGSAAQADVACLNAAAALYVGGRAADLAVGLEQARAALASGAARRVLDRLVEFTRG
jgi:anthranilate phosphoribosyltransferase